MKPSPSYLRERLTYNEQTGEFIWNHHESMTPQWNGRYAGKPAFAGKHATTGYNYSSICDRPYTAQRVAVAMMTGAWPLGEVDHINGDRLDNRWCNLRVVSRQTNAKNMQRHVDNTSGFSGVSWDKQLNKWHAKICVNRKQNHLGYFSDKADAISARKAALKKYEFHPNHGRAA